MDSTASHAKGAPQKIRVIDVRRHLVDPTAAGQEELALALAVAAEAPGLADAGGALQAMLDLARQAQGPLAALLAESPPDALDSLLARALLASPAVRPVYAARGALAEESTAGNVRTRAAARVRAIDPRGADAALAAEEPADVEAFAVDPLAAGAAALALLGRPRALPILSLIHI